MGGVGASPPPQRGPRVSPPPREGESPGLREGSGRRGGTGVSPQRGAGQPPIPGGAVGLVPPVPLRGLAKAQGPPCRAMVALRERGGQSGSPPHGDGRGGSPRCGAGGESVGGQRPPGPPGRAPVSPKRSWGWGGSQCPPLRSSVWLTFGVGGTLSCVSPPASNQVPAVSGAGGGHVGGRGRPGGGRAPPAGPSRHHETHTGHRHERGVTPPDPPSASPPAVCAPMGGVGGTRRPWRGLAPSPLGEGWGRGGGRAGGGGGGRGAPPARNRCGLRVV